MFLRTHDMLTKYIKTKSIIYSYTLLAMYCLSVINIILADYLLLGIWGNRKDNIYVIGYNPESHH